VNTGQQNAVVTFFVSTDTKKCCLCCRLAIVIILFIATPPPPYHGAGDGSFSSPEETSCSHDFMGIADMWSILSVDVGANEVVD
jgi:hypothetical protein